MNQQDLWFEEFRKSPFYETLKKRPIAYFCAEFALSEKLPIYAGGLGVLAADLVTEASDQKIPLVAVGLYYHEGYVFQGFDKADPLPRNDPKLPSDLGLIPVLDANGQRLLVRVPVLDRHVSVQAWCIQVGSVSVYLLDTNVSENEPLDMRITDRLYVGNKETRFKQEMILGIGGLRLLEAIGIHPIVYHLNEGHSAMLAIEIAYHEMKEHKKAFLEELEIVKKHIVFTNHTLIATGDDTYSNDLVTALLKQYAQELQVPDDKLVSLGLVQETSIFSMTMLALRMAGTINAVSRLHAKKAASLWTDHPMIAITNGIHLPTWDAIGQGGNIWSTHQKNKRVFLEYIYKETGETWDENELLLGWARRIVGYKRPLALFDDLARFKIMSKNPHRPIRVVFAGHPHQNDEEGMQLFESLKKMIHTDLKGTVVYLPNYDTALAKQMVAGCDVWFNTPVVGFEACGTSGMKAALNGALPATSKDGWVDEVELFGVGWILDTDKIAQNLLDMLEYQIVPMYYENHSLWQQHMKNARELIQNEFSTAKMLRNYIEQMYMPQATSLHP